MTESRITLYVGGASSGKSLLAEQRALSLAARRLYVATMAGLDEETKARIGAHQARRGAGWQTVETGTDLSLALSACPEAGVVLVDSVGVWLAGLLSGVYRNGAAEAEDGIWEYVAAFEKTALRSSRPLVLVSDEAGLGLVPADRLSRRFRDALGRLNRRLAELADEVYFVSCGIPLCLKSATNQN